MCNGFGIHRPVCRQAETQIDCSLGVLDRKINFFAQVLNWGFVTGVMENKSWRFKKG